MFERSGDVGAPSQWVLLRDKLRESLTDHTSGRARVELRPNRADGLLIGEVIQLTSRSAQDGCADVRIDFSQIRSASVPCGHSGGSVAWRETRRMGKVRGEHHVVWVQIDLPLYSPFIPDGRVHLPLEVFARKKPLGVLGTRRGVHELPVERL